MVHIRSHTEAARATRQPKLSAGSAAAAWPVSSESHKVLATQAGRCFAPCACAPPPVSQRTADFLSARRLAHASEPCGRACETKYCEVVFPAPYTVITFPHAPGSPAPSRGAPSAIAPSQGETCPEDTRCMSFFRGPCWDMRLCASCQPRNSFACAVEPTAGSSSLFPALCSSSR